MSGVVDGMEAGSAGAGANAAKRVAGLDVARAVAIFGMMIVNFESAVTGTQPATGWLAKTVLALEGRAVPIFVILAGIGVSLMAGRGGLRHGRAVLNGVLLKRALFLFVTGLMLRSLWPPDILHYYALYMLGAMVVLRFAGFRFWLLAAVPVAISIFYMVGGEVFGGLDWQEISRQSIASPGALLRHLLVLGHYPVFPWFTFFMAGIWIGRLDLTRPRTLWMLGGAGALFFWGAFRLADLAIDQLIDYIYAADAFSMMFLCEIEAFPATPLYLVSGAGSALMVFAAALLASRKAPDSRIVADLAAVGRLALTAYVGHIVLGINGLRWMGLGTDRSYGFAVSSALICFAATVLFARFWCARFTIGPLEWGMRIFSGSPEVRQRLVSRTPQGAVVP